MVGKQSPSRLLFVIFNYLIFTLIVIICTYPLWYVLVQSLSGSTRAGAALIVPSMFTLSNYLQVFQLEGIFHSLLISVLRTVIGAGLTVLCCMLLGYLFSKEQMPFRKLLYRTLTVTMYVSGGLIPTYLVMRSYGMINSFLIYILPTLVSAYYVILIKTFVEQIPASVEESAMLDGAGHMRIFIQLILPMSLPIVATIAVYASVHQWNAWFDNMIYNSQTDSLTTLQYLLYRFLNEAEELAKQMAENGSGEAMASVLTPKGVRMTMTVVTLIPVMMIYPFLQRYFVKGIMIGAVKG